MSYIGVARARLAPAPSGLRKRKLATKCKCTLCSSLRSYIGSLYRPQSRGQQVSTFYPCPHMGGSLSLP